MKDIRVFKLDEFKGGRVLGYTADAGEIDIRTKEDVIASGYSAGSLVLYDKRGFICGPLTMDAARDLAERVLDGDPRAVTDPKTLTLLATAVAGWLLNPETDEPAPAAIAMEPSHA